MMQIPRKLLDLFEQNHVQYELLQHPEKFTAQELAESDHVKGRHYAKVVMIKAGNEQLMTVVPADHRVDLGELEQIIGKPATLADERDFQSLFPECAVGAMPPFGNLYNVRTLVDKSLAEDEWIVFEAGTHTDAVKMSYADYQRLAKPEVADFARKIRPIQAA
jgi:Ala-tRNA(Pro) deacylase